MNKVILMGRLTRDPDVRYSAGAIPQPQTLSDALLSAARQNLQRNICVRERRSPSPAAFRPEATPTVKARRFTRQT